MYTFRNVVLVAAALISLYGCSPVWLDQQNNSTNQAPVAKLQSALKTADYDAYNIAVLREPGNYRGKVLSFTGTLNTRPLYDTRERNVAEISGNYNHYLINFILTMDHPLQQEKQFGDDVQIISNGKHVRVFAEFIEVQTFLNESGIQKKIPVARLIAIFQPEDQYFRTPLWVSNDLR